MARHASREIPADELASIRRHWISTIMQTLNMGGHDDLIERELQKLSDVTLIALVEIAERLVRLQRELRERAVP